MKQYKLIMLNMVLLNGLLLTGCSFDSFSDKHYDKYTQNKKHKLSDKELEKVNASFPTIGPNGINAKTYYYKGHIHNTDPLMDSKVVKKIVKLINNE